MILRFARAHLAALLCLALVACTAAPGPSPDAPPLTTAERALLGRMMLDQGPDGEFARVLRRVYPAEADYMARRVAAIMARGESEAATRAAVNEVGAEIRRRHAAGLLQASDATLAAYLDSSRAGLEHLSDRPQLCRTLMSQGLQSLPMEAQADLLAALLPQIRIRVEAMAEGERSPVGRTTDPAEVLAAAERILGRLTPAERDAFMRDEASCGTMIRFFQMLATDSGPGAEALRAQYVWRMARR
ncbi:hypothetical protein P2H44_09315 [Albimonas sp. CAU 1670]|uniref:hypothetical protein n=1 Tax=Albimonas sp. CAU 1670 TaxID=3032599 RepID=UPI0023D9CE8B|nr:hypothetical protein [Albimonas sp. CAU 1670]MDF2232750.1 hypothetical protein [Albimonas sp. CAU 1670]